MLHFLGKYYTLSTQNKRTFEGVNKSKIQSILKVVLKGHGILAQPADIKSIVPG